MSLVVALVAGALTPAASRAADPGVILGSPLQIYMDGVGHLQVHVFGFPTSELDPPSLNLADPSRQPGLLFRLIGGNGLWGGCSGAPPTFVPGLTPVSGPTVATGSGTRVDPFTMSAVYDCSGGPPMTGLEITQTFAYVNGDSDFTASYAIKALDLIPTASVRFRATAFGAFDLAGAGFGTGFHDPADASGPQDVGVLNDDTGVLGGLGELPGSPWSAYMAGSAGSISFAAAGPPLGDQVGPGLDNSVVDSAQPAGAAAQFDRYVSVGLAAGATDTFAVDWFFGHYPGLTLDTDSDTNTVGRTQTVTATSLDHGQPVQGGTVRYSITGANPASGAITTGPAGTAAITWVGTRAGQDTVSAYIDADNNGVFDPTIDTGQSGVITWSPAPPPPVTAPVSTGAPVVSGAAQVGGQLTCSSGTWSGSTPQTYTYQWLRDGTPVSAPTAAGAAYPVARPDAGHALVCVVTATNGAGSAGARSAAVAVPPQLSAKLAGVAVRLAAFLRGGLKATESCSAACAVTIVASLDPAQARRAGLGHARTVLGRVSGRLTGAGRLQLTIKPSAKIRSKLRRAKLTRLTVTLNATVTDAQGHAVAPGATGLTIKR
jgi:hypothetical protein